MSGRWNRKMSTLLDALGQSDTLVPCAEDRVALVVAANILSDRERLVTSRGEPEIIIASGEGANEVMYILDGMETDMEETADRLATMQGNMDDLRRQLRADHTQSNQIEELTEALQNMAHELLQIETRCPCGARPETIATHPHAAGCHVAAALDMWQALALPTAATA